jgi:hypothetical protein
MDPAVIDKMIDLAKTAAQAETGAPGPVSASASPAADSDASTGRPGDDPLGAVGQGQVPGPGSPYSTGLSPEAWRALRYAMARLAVDLVSGPAGVAAVLRRGLLDKPYNTPSLPLDIGYSDAIPGHIRRAVLLRDHTCAWPRCGRPAVYCDVHHLRHKEDGGETTRTAPPKRAALTADRSSTATRRPPRTQPDGAGSRLVRMTCRSSE